MQSYNSCLCPFCVHLIQTVTQTSAHKTSSVHVKVLPLSLHPDLEIFYRICCASQVQIVKICNSLLFPKDGPFCAGLITKFNTSPEIFWVVSFCSEGGLQVASAVQQRAPPMHLLSYN